MVLTELLQNAVEHGYPEESAEPERGRSWSSRSGSRAGSGSPSTTTGSACRTGFDLDTSVNLGLSIVRTLVESELGGLLELRPRAGRGARAVVDVPLE